MKFFIVSVLAYALVAQAAVLPIVPHVGQIGHAVAAGVATSVGIGAAAGIHTAVHAAEKVGDAVVGTGLGALELGSGVASGIKDGISNGIHGLGLGSDRHIGQPEIIDRPENPRKEGPVDLINENGGDIGDKLHKDFDLTKRDKRDEGFEYDQYHASHEHKEHDSHEHKEHDSHEHKEHEHHGHGKHHDYHKRDKRDSRKFDNRDIRRREAMQ